MGGAVGLSGYLPMAVQLTEMRNIAKTADEGGSDREKRWFVVQGTKDRLVPASQIEKTKKMLSSLDPDCVETHICENTGHPTRAAELRDLSTWLEMATPASAIRDLWGG